MSDLKALAVQAHGRAILGELRDSVKTARDVGDPHISTQHLHEANFHRRRLAAWIERNLVETYAPWGDELRAYAGTSFSHGDPGRYGDVFSDAITDYRGLRQERIVAILRDVRILQKALAIAGNSFRRPIPNPKPSRRGAR